MDLTIKLDDGYFNYRVAGVIIDNDRLLVMYNKECGSYYLPGGRVMLHESSKSAIKREIREELHIEIDNFRPIWLHQNFFIEEQVNEKFHELCIYYLININNTDFNNFEDEFSLDEGNNTNFFKWISFEKLGEQLVYPIFIKDEIFNLPDSLEMKIDYEY
ncbi:MAG: NUDIX domain-containing protein [Bacteroides sp.]|nr:NUDIX domain-containing protein [Bacteroides sp.]MCM1434391.1 NUDIX domain-containing protein [Clostridiales bacterium]